MKKWYKADKPMVKEFGRFPIFWQDLKKWQHWGAIYKKYLGATQEKEAKEAPVSAAVADGGDAAAVSADATASSKRKSRWGDAGTQKKKRKSRWSTEKTNINPSLAGAMASGSLTPGSCLFPSMLTFYIIIHTLYL